MWLTSASFRSGFPRSQSISVPLSLAVQLTCVPYSGGSIQTLYFSKSSKTTVKKTQTSQGPALKKYNYTQQRLLESKVCVFVELIKTPLYAVGWFNQAFCGDHMFVVWLSCVNHVSLKNWAELRETLWWVIFTTGNAQFILKHTSDRLHANIHSVMLEINTLFAIICAVPLVNIHISRSKKDFLHVVIYSLMLY